MSTSEAIAGMSVDELKKALAEKEGAQKAEQTKKRNNYEKRREGMLNHLGAKAIKLSNLMEELKAQSFEELAGFREQMIEYGDLRGGEKNKGSFEIKNEKFKVQFATQVVKRFDERASMAEAKMNTFLTGFVKARDRKLFNMISGLLRRKEDTGEFDIDLINRLYSMEDQFEDQDWLDAIRLFKEAYSPVGTAQYVRFYKALANGGYEAIVLDFAKVKVAAKETV
jgi:hypothetical protein